MRPNRISLIWLEFTFAFVTSPDRERPGALQRSMISMQSSKRERRRIISLTDTVLTTLIFYIGFRASYVLRVPE